METLLAPVSFRHKNVNISKKKKDNPKKENDILLYFGNTKQVFFML